MSLSLQRRRQVVVRLRKFRLHAHGILIGGERAGDVASRLKRVAETTVRVRRARPQTERSAISSRRFVRPAERLQRVPEMDVRAGVLRIQPDGFVEDGDGFVEIAWTRTREQGRTEIAACLD